MDIYTAERLPILFAKFGKRKKLWLRPVTKEQYDPDNFCREKLAGEVWLDCPYVLTLDVRDDHDDLQLKAHELKKIIRRAAFNIATRRAEEHVYDMGGGEVRILAGEGSIQHFRNNFCKRLAEVFYNLEWILNHPSVADFDENEFRLYESFYHACESFYSASRPPALAIAAHVYKRLKERLEP